MSAQIIQFHKRRPGNWVWCICLWCRTRFHAWVPVKSRNRYHEGCPGCDETAAVEAWKVWQ